MTKSKITLIKCSECKNKINLNREVIKSENKGVKEIRCPYCNKKIGEVN
jgi:DNA-directed RNA polymerase subunit RPC12/RpoP